MGEGRRSVVFDGVPPAEEVRRSVVRGRHAVVRLNAATEMPTVSRLATALRSELARDDLLVLASPGDPPTIRVIRLVDEHEAHECRAELETLVADFRRLARRLVGRFRAEVAPDWEREEPDAGRIEVDGAEWWLSPHGEHCRFEHLGSGHVVEADVMRPEAVDPGFLLLFAESSGGYAKVRAACAEGFHDMCRMLELAGVTGTAG
ncbi:DUF6896 domain-containing protein [Actinoallomurus sp. CA-150999]|uniref:DUF6896 domain-containing protein n=1 Tax=Actinoallomurus sp. CA-150999 TaxID=3239887 RepID=UPI003D9421A4